MSSPKSIVTLALTMALLGSQASHADAQEPLLPVDDFFEELPFRGMPSQAPGTAAITLTRSRHTWYGWQFILSDGAMIAATYASANPAPLIVGYFLGPLVVHAANDNAKRGLHSLVMRFTFPLSGVVLLGGKGLKRQEGVVIGGIGGLALALAIDYLWSSRSSTYTTAEPPSSQSLALGRCRGLSRCTTLGYQARW